MAVAEPDTSSDFFNAVLPGPQHSFCFFNTDVPKKLPKGYADMVIKNDWLTGNLPTVG